VKFAVSSISQIQTTLIHIHSATIITLDIYSLSIILFELFSGTDPFPGSMGQIWQAKIQNEKPEIPSKFPALLKELVLTGWSKKPRERPEIEKISLALNIMEKEEEEKKALGVLLQLQ
jgi:serine/threonine protein kinase